MATLASRLKVAALCWLLTAGAGASGATLGRVYSADPDRQAPIWLAAEEALLTDAGPLRWELFAPDEASRLRRYLEDTELARSQSESERPTFETPVSRVESDLCPVVTVTTSPPALEHGHDGLAELIRGARAAVSGRISDITPGFFMGRPALLLTLVVDAHASRNIDPTQPARVVYSDASFQAGGELYCGTSFKHAPRPEVGDEIVVLSQYGPEQGTELFRPSQQEIALARPSGELLLPLNLAADDELVGVATVRDLRAKIELGWRLWRSAEGSGER